MFKLMLCAVSLTTLLSAAVLMSQASVAQFSSVAECDGNFKAADVDGDGWLDAGEIAAASDLIPSRLATRSEISRQDYISACRDNVRSDVK